MFLRSKKFFFIFAVQDLRHDVYTNVAPWFTPSKKKIIFKDETKTIVTQMYIKSKYKFNLKKKEVSFCMEAEDEAKKNTKPK